MAKRGTVTDFTGMPAMPGDVIVYAARAANLVRMTEATIESIGTEKIKGRVFPVLKVRPTGRISGFLGRVTDRTETIRSEHWVVTQPAEG